MHFSLLAISVWQITAPWWLWGCNICCIMPLRPRIQRFCLQVAHHIRQPNLTSVFMLFGICLIYSATLLICPRHVNFGRLFIDVRSSQLVTVGDHSLSTAGPHLCNSPPEDVQSASTMTIFCRQLKVYLFRQCRQCCITIVHLEVTLHYIRTIYSGLSGWRLGFMVVHWS